MKVFVYSKKTSKKVAEIKKVVMVQEIPEDHKIEFVTDSGEVMTFDTKSLKSTIYQN